MAPNPYNKYHALDVFCKEEGYDHAELTYFGDDYGQGGNDEAVFQSDFDFVKVDKYTDLPKIMEEYLKIGSIISTHALKGEVKVYPTTEDVRRYDDLDRVYIDGRFGKECLRVERVRYFKNLVIVKFCDLDRIEDVERLKGAELLIPREDAIELEEGEYFIPDLLGLKVTTDDGRELGVIRDVIETGANNVYDVRGEEGKGILIPAIPDCILDVNLEEGTMLVHLLPGLENL
jgi:16S rRNA processing protein RimM